MERFEVPADGNCFFRAASLHLDHDETSLRAALCNHMEDNLQNYIGFFSTEGSLTEEEKVQAAKTQIEMIRQPGQWNSQANDILPFALANYSNRRVKIFSSRRNQPVINVRPSTPHSIFQPICLALLAPPIGIPEHYDGCVAVKRHIYSMFNPSPGTPVSLASSTPTSSAQPSRPAPPSLPPQQPAPLSPPEQRPAPPSPPPQQPVSPSPPLQQPVTPPPAPQQPAQPSSPSTSSMPPPPPLLTPPRFQSSETATASTSRQPNIYMTPPKKTPPRKRKADPVKWKKNIRKQLKLEGKQYTTSRGKISRAKKVQDMNCKCKLKCSEKVNEMQRQAIFDMFYSLGSVNRQRDFVCRHVDQKETLTYLDEKKEPVKNSRQVTRKFFLTVDGNRIQVCKRFFQGTLDVGHGFIDTTMKNSENGTFTGEDKRGKHTPSNKTTEDSRARVKRHIESFPAVESHYCRQRCKKKFLDSTLNINKMYSFYCDMCKDEGTEPVSSSLYREIFNTQYNLDFHKPKKDLCMLCSRYLQEKRGGETTEERKREYEEHIERKKESREEKAKDKELSKHADEVHCATFDLESVLPTPCSTISQVHYKRKLAVYNLTVFSLSDKEATCYLWDETEGNKGSCEIATCLVRYIESLPKCVKHVILYSDTCGGQNRNKFVASALLYAVRHIENIQIIDQKFLESGHSHMECDSVHATIEKAKKNLQIFIPEMWHPVIQTARSSSNPYTLDVLEHDDFYDFKQVASSTLRNTKIDTDGKQVHWLKIKWIRYMKTENDTLFFKYRMPEPFKHLKIRGNSRRKRADVTIHELPRRYDRRLPISDAKKRDLLDLCYLGIVPKKHHSYYLAIPSNTSVPDRLAEPDVTEDIDSDDE